MAEVYHRRIGPGARIAMFVLGLVLAWLCYAAALHLSGDQQIWTTFFCGLISIACFVSAIRGTDLQ